MRIAIALMFSIISIHSFAEQITEDIRQDTETAAEAILQADKSTFAHARRDSTQTPDKARQMINMWIRFNMKNALEEKKKGNMKDALLFLYTARHALRDATSPDANDANGDPAVASGNVGKHKPATAIKDGWSDKVDQDIQLMFDRGEMPPGDLLRMYGIDTDSGPVNRPNQGTRPAFAQ